MSEHERAEVALITRGVGGHRTRRNVSAAATLAAAVLAFALFASVANATTTVTYAPGGANAGLTITGGGPSGEDADRVVIISLASSFKVRRFGFGTPPAVTAGAGCTQSDENGVECAVTGVRVITARMGTGNDRLDAGGSDSKFIRGGPGNDVINGGGGDESIDGDEGNDTLNGGNGNDVVSGGDGDDSFPIASTSGAGAVFNGGTGFDTMSFDAASTAGVSVSLDNVANDGIGGLQNVKSDIEKLVGTAGNDVFTGSGAPNRLEGLAGNDTLRGGEGGDTLDGGLGVDVLGGQGGGDLLLARDGVDDQSNAAMSCGREALLSGRAVADRVVADLKDDDTRPIPADCESVDQSDRREGPNVVVRSRSVSMGRDKVLSVRLSCPRKLRRTCSGTLTSRVDKRRTRFGRRTRYSIRPGRSATIKTRLPASHRAAARRRGARVLVRSLERGLLGAKTTVRPLPVRRA